MSIGRAATRLKTLKQDVCTMKTVRVAPPVTMTPAVAACLALAMIVFGGGCDRGAPGSDPVPPLPALHAEGTKIVDDAGAEVILRGVNLGGWLFNETWITQIDYPLLSRIHVIAVREGLAEVVDPILTQKSSEWQGSAYLTELESALAAEIGTEAAATFVDKVEPYTPPLYDDSDLLLRRKLSERFGDAARDQLLDTFQEAWVNETDIEWIASQGFNVVRVPMTYRNLVTGPDLDAPTELSWNELTWTRIGRLLDWCERHRIYAVLDIQEAPGGQNDYTGQSLLYGSPALQDLTVELWVEIATRFGGHSAVAAYSLLAEPFSAPDPGARDAMYDKLYDAIRALGDDHLLVIHDGFFGMNTLPDPAAYGWENVVYSTHIFEFDAKSLEDYEFLINIFHETVYTEAQAAQGVPYYIGSFSTRNDADWAYDAAQLMIDWYTGHGWSWSVWTYKRIDDPIAFELLGKTSSYGVRTMHEGPFDRPDAFDDDFDTHKAKLAAYRDLPLDPNQRLLDILTSPM